MWNVHIEFLSQAHQQDGAFDVTRYAEPCNNVKDTFLDQIALFGTSVKDAFFIVLLITAVAVAGSRFDIRIWYCLLPLIIVFLNLSVTAFLKNKAPDQLSLEKTVVSFYQHIVNGIDGQRQPSLQRFHSHSACRLVAKQQNQQGDNSCTEFLETTWKETWTTVRKLISEHIPAKLPEEFVLFFRRDAFHVLHADGIEAFFIYNVTFDIGHEGNKLSHAVVSFTNSAICLNNAWHLLDGKAGKLGLVHVEVLEPASGSLQGDADNTESNVTGAHPDIKASQTFLRYGAGKRKIFASTMHLLRRPLPLIRSIEPRRLGCVIQFIYGIGAMLLFVPVLLIISKLWVRTLLYGLLSLLIISSFIPWALQDERAHQGALLGGVFGIFIALRPADYLILLSNLSPLPLALILAAFGDAFGTSDEKVLLKICAGFLSGLAFGAVFGAVAVAPVTLLIFAALFLCDVALDYVLGRMLP